MSNSLQQFARLSCWLACAMATMSLSPIAAQDFNRDIRPILSDRCFKCHGFDEAANESGVRLDLAEAAYESESFVPGDIDASYAIERILSDDADLKMPPPDSHLEITDDELELLKSWVKQGAKYDQHWAFKPLPRFVVVPHFSMLRDWIQNDIDVFVLREIESRGLQPAPEAERWRWLRRVTYDLTGLPPTAEEIAAFAADESWQAHETVVDRLLASPEFGEHMAVSWLDVARYADSYGYQSDQLNNNWPYRDWVVRALNENLPYDQFLTWQLAGDLLPDATKDQILATAFNRLHRMTNEGGSVELEWRTEYVADRVNTFGTAILGLTLECARCHDHKFDPVSQKEYYSMSAFFNNIDEWGMYNDGSRVNTPTVLSPTPQQQQRLDDAYGELTRIRIGSAVEYGVFFDDENELPDMSSTVTVDLHVVSEAIEGVRRAGRVAHWSLDERVEGKFLNSVEGREPATTAAANVSVPGKAGQALRLTGDDAVHFPVDDEWLEPWKPFSVSMWIKIPEGLEEAVVLHRQGGTDVGTFGTRLALFEGKLRLEVSRFWPGNAIAIEATEEAPVGEWIHVVITNSGYGTGNSLGLFVNGVADHQVLRSGLQKDPQHRPGNQTGFAFGQQFRRVGFKDGEVDEVSFFTFALSPIEVRSLMEDQPQLALAGFEKSAIMEHQFVATRSIEERSEIIEACRVYLTSSTGITETSVMKEMPGQSVAHVLNRGEYDAPRTEKNQVGRGTPASLPDFSEQFSRDRLGLANWLTDAQHPLAARVAVNRIWQGFFGYGLIETPNDLGYQSTMPVYADMLDSMSRKFIDSGWDVKKLCKQIVLSGTYRQSSVCDAELRKLDPQNQFLARGPANRLSAEMVRDTALFVSGLLDQKTGGPAVSPYQPPNLWRENNTMTPAYRQSVGKDLYRRSLYTVWKRTTPIPNMMTFDAPTREVCVVQRARTNTPQQAMVLLNDVQFVEAARVMAERIFVDETLETDAAKIGWLFQRLAGRDADDRELAILLELLSEQRERFAAEPENARKLIATGESPVAETDDPVEIAALTVLAQAVFNCDATIWKR